MGITAGVLMFWTGIVGIVISVTMFVVLPGYFRKKRENILKEQD